MNAIQQPNVNVHFTGVSEITETGVIGEDGIEREVDTIVCATGFDVTYRPQKRRRPLPKVEGRA
jgi:cation diffusion facilitator CzcD-associated flavoprotein CzcO